jgi:phosphoglycolate phosphatase-like HAD superfamily hydrolase
MGALCGIRDRAQLELHQPDLIVSNLAAAVDLLLTVNK